MSNTTKFDTINLGGKSQAHNCTNVSINSDGGVDKGGTASASSVHICAVTAAFSCSGSMHIKLLLLQGSAAAMSGNLHIIVQQKAQLAMQLAVHGVSI